MTSLRWVSVCVRRARTIVLLAATACADDSVATAPSLAKGGGGPSGGGSGGTPTVTATDPVSARKDTTLDVRIFGSGFDTKSRADWALAGVVDPTRVKTNRTTVVSSTELVANITITEFAPSDAYDVIVTAGTGKKGIATELFEITGDPMTDFLIPAADAELALRSDRLYPEGEYFVYASRVCGVYSKIFAAETASGDAIMYTDNPKYSDRKCGSYPRKVTVVLGSAPGDHGTIPAKLNLNALQGGGAGIPIGETASRDLLAELAWSRCARLYYGAGRHSLATGSDQVMVTRTSASTWEVRTSPGRARAWCSTDGRFYEVPVHFIIRSDRPLD